MANKTETIERVYNIPLRASFRNAVRMKKAKKAIRAVKDFLRKHMKSDDVRLGNHLNEQVWSRGMRRPPHHVKVLAIKDKDGVVKAELDGYKWVETVKPIKREAQQGGIAGKLADLKQSAEAEAQDAKDEKAEKKPAAKKATTKKAPAKKETSDAEAKKV